MQKNRQGYNKFFTKNKEGIKLQEQFTYDKTVDYILDKIEKDLIKE
jgi:hypothetical protein